jgi:hypothetical protein
MTTTEIQNAINDQRDAFNAFNACGDTARADASATAVKGLESMLALAAAIEAAPVRRHRLGSQPTASDVATATTTQSNRAEMERIKWTVVAPAQNRAAA